MRCMRSCRPTTQADNERSRKPIYLGVAVIGSSALTKGSRRLPCSAESFNPLVSLQPNVGPHPLADAVPHADTVGGSRAPELRAYAISDGRDRLSPRAFASRLAGSCQ